MNIDRIKKLKYDLEKEIQQTIQEAIDELNETGIVIKQLNIITDLYHAPTMSYHPITKIDSVQFKIEL